MSPVLSLAARIAKRAPRLAALVSSLLAAFDLVGAGLIVGPARVELSGEPGGSQQTVVTITNSAGAPQRFSVSVVPFDLSLTGDVLLEGVEAAGPAPKEWIHASPEEMEIPGGGAAQVRIRVDTPEGAKGTLWGGVLVQIPPAASARSGVGVVTQPQVLVPVYLTVRGSESLAAEIVSVESVRDLTGRVHFRATLRNDGNALLRPAGTWLLEEATPAGPIELVSVPFSGHPVLPGHERKFEAEAGGVVLGAAQTATVFFDFGMEQGQLVSRSTPVAASPTPPSRETRHVASAVAEAPPAAPLEGSAAVPLRLTLVKEGILLRGGSGATRYRSEVPAEPVLLVELVGYRVEGPRVVRGSRLIESLEVEEVSTKPVITRLKARFKVPVDAKILERSDGLLVQLKKKEQGATPAKRSGTR